MSTMDERSAQLDYTDPPARRMHPLAAAGIGLAVGILATMGCQAMWSFVTDLAGFGDTRLADAAKTCETTRIGLFVNDDGRTLTMLVGDSGIDPIISSCVLNQLKSPTSVKALIATTRGVDGRQTATWAGLTATWTSYDTEGMQIIITR